MRDHTLFFRVLLCSVTVAAVFGLFSHGASATVFIEECQDPNYLFDTSDIVVAGTVSAVEAGSAETRIAVAVEQFLKGSAPYEIVVKQEGGTDMLIAGITLTYAVGERTILYLEANEDATFSVVCGENGKKTFFAGTELATMIRSILVEGDLLRGPDGVRVYILNAAGFKRHVFNPEVFGMYGHLRWDRIRDLDGVTLGVYATSDLVQQEGDYRVYLLERADDSSTTKRWLDMTPEEFSASGYQWDQVFRINAGEFNYYQEGSPVRFGTSEAHHAFTNVSQGAFSRFAAEDSWVINDSESLASLWASVGSTIDPFPPPNVDFSSETVLAVAFGQHPTGGYWIDIRDVVVVNERVYVKVMRRSPAPNCVVIQALTYPYHVVKTEKITKEIIFQFSDTALSCG